MFTISHCFSTVKNRELKGCQCHNRTFDSRCLPIYIYIQDCGPGTSSSDQICCADVEESDLNKIVNFSDEDANMGVSEKGTVRESQTEQNKGDHGETERTKGDDAKPKRQVRLDKHGKLRKYMGKFRRRPRHAG